MDIWYDLRVATYNCGDGPDKNKLGDLEDLVKQGASAILGQEFGDRQRLVALFTGVHETWKPVWGRRRNKTREPVILYDTKQLKLTKWQQALIKIGYLGPQGKGGDAPGTKAITTGVWILRRARRRVRLVNTHAVVSAFSTHGAERARRIAAYIRQMTKFFAIARLSKIVTIGGGDMNALPKNRVLRRLMLKNWRWDGKGDTHRHEDIDLIGHKVNPNVRFVETTIIETDGSRRIHDHRARLNHYQVRGRRRR